jgi:DNA-binding winged helix-turn-helix (wHTH) protein/TolB-like protein/Flp pilus assembly protein TadD
MVTNGPSSRTYEFGEFRLDAAKRLLTKDTDLEISLTPKVFDTLLYLVRNSGKVVEKDELMQEIWPDSIVEENNLTQNISVLRRRLGEKPGEQLFIATIAGHGYRFVPEVSVFESEEDTGGAGVDRASGDMVRDQTHHKRAPIQKRKSMIALAAFCFLSLVSVGFYLWLSDQGTNNTSIRSLAVLPFKPLVPENRNEALEFGLADTLISELSRGEDIVVRPLSAIRRYSSVEQDALTAARELGVESILDGTIQNWGERIRVSAKLMRTSDGKQLWAGQFDEKVDDIFTVQDVISEKVASALKIRLGSNNKKHSTENVEAYQLYSKGRYHTAKGTPEDLRSSISYFQQAIDIDPGYALAYTGLAKAFGVLGIIGEMPTAVAFQQARAAEQKALELDNSLAEAHIALCMDLFWYGWDWPSADKRCLRGIEIDPNNADSHGNYALVLSNTGRHEQALAEAKRSRELDPLNLAQSSLEGQFLVHAGRVDDALDRLRKVMKLEPNFALAHLFAASAYIEKGMFTEAIAESEKEHQLSGRNEIPFGPYALAKSGKRDEARRALEVLLARSSNGYIACYNIALIYNALDERGKALDWLEKGYEARDPKMTFLKVEPKWRNLQNEPRFQELLQRMNFPL